uniref:Uncharacterized protein n=1 Tax=Plectus sambesii TaxID=2011161 RepID=A0A914X6N2_9BILA
MTSRPTSVTYRMHAGFGTICPTIAVRGTTPPATSTETPRQPPPAPDRITRDPVMHLKRRRRRGRMALEIAVDGGGGGGGLRESRMFGARWKKMVHSH